MRTSCLIGLGALLLTTAGSARAQICAGYPTADRSFSFGGRIDFPEDANALGIEGNYNAGGPLAVFAAISRVSFDNDDEDLTVFTGGAAFDFNIPGTPTRPFFSVCPIVQIDYAKEGDITFRDIPIGIGVGSSIPMGAGGQNAFMPYVIPAIVFSRVSVDGDSESDENFALRAGGLVAIRVFYIGAEVTHVFEDGGDPVFGIRFGMRP